MLILVPKWSQMSYLFSLLAGTQRCSFFDVGISHRKMINVWTFGKMGFWEHKLLFTHYIQTKWNHPGLPFRSVTLTMQTHRETCCSLNPTNKLSTKSFEKFACNKLS